MAFVHLINHSEYSMLQSTIRLSLDKKQAKTGLFKTLAEQVAEFEQTAVALTDHGNMFGALDFYFSAKKKGLNPILGCEIYIDTKEYGFSAPSYDRIALLVKNEEGYSNLKKIVSYGFLDGFNQKPLVPLSFIQKHTEGLFALYGGMNSTLAAMLFRDKLDWAQKAMEFYSTAFGDHFYLRLENHGRPEETKLLQFTAQLAQNCGVQTVVTNNNHYLNKNDGEIHRIIQCIERGSRLSESEFPDFPTDEYYYKSPAEMEALFKDYPAALENTQKIADQCSISIRTNIGDEYWPRFEFPTEFEDSDAYLAHFTWERAHSYYPDMTEEVRKRIDYELVMMKSMKVAGYMLIVQDFINWAKNQGIPVGPGRGSAVGSIVAYIIGITDVDPLRFGLLFERFLNPERVSMPDIDTDFSDKDREKVIQYVTQKYGKDCVSQIVTYSRMKAKAAIRDVGRAMEVPLGEVDRIAKLIPTTPGVSLKESWEGKEDEEMGRVLRELIESKSSYQELWKRALYIENLVRQPGIHAAAVIIAPRPLVELAPMYKAPGEDAVVIQYDKTYAEDIGLLKMDFLGLRNLSVIQDAVAMVKENHDVTLKMERVDMEDTKTFELLGKGMTVGVFQFESGGMQNYLRQLKPTCIEDMIAMNALYRPGPIEQIPHFVKRKNGQEDIDCYHQNLEPILGETYGVIVYQEQVMRLAQDLAGFTLGGADILRRIMGKKDKEKMPQYHSQFVGGAEARGYEARLADQIWETLIPFCNYAFNKSHSAAYAFVGYQTAWLKAHYPAEFMAANLTSEMTTTDRLVILLQECRALGIEILPPDINRSLATFSVLDQKINYGMAGIKGVGQAFVETVVQERQENGPFKTLFEFCKRMSWNSQLNKRALESLIMAGAFDSCNPNRAALFASVGLATEYGSQAQRQQETGQVSLFDMGGNDGTNEMAKEPDLREVHPWTYIEALGKEREVMGTFISGHPLEEYRRELAGFCTHNLNPDLVGQIEPYKRPGWGVKDAPPPIKYTFGGMLSSWKVMASKKDGSLFAFGTLEDFDGKLDLACWSENYAKLRDKLTPEALVILEGKVTPAKDEGKIQFEIENVVPLEDARKKWARYIHIELDCSALNPADMEELDELMDDFQSSDSEGCEVVFHLQSETHTHILASRKSKVDCDLDFLKYAEEVAGKNRVWFTKELQ